MKTKQIKLQEYREALMAHAMRVAKEVHGHPEDIRISPADQRMIWNEIDTMGKFVSPAKKVPIRLRWV